MLKAYLIITLIISNTVCFSCTCELISFCETASDRPEDNIFKVVIIEETGHSIKVLRLETIRGDEEKDTLIIWDGTDYDCNGNISMAASQIGLMGDTLLIILPVIDSIENLWDVAGDYRMPDWLCNTYELKVENNILHGDINGVYPYYYLGNYNYDEFIESWFLGAETCSMVPSTFVSYDDGTTFIKVFPNPSGGQFVINTASLSGCMEYQVIDFSGRLITQRSFSRNENLIDLSDCPDGVYLFILKADGEIFFTTKLVRSMN